jgi:hypothetical protein
MKYRWLDTEQPVVSVAAEGASHGWLRGCIGAVVAVATPSPRIKQNVLVDFGGHLVIVPVGTLRRWAE